MNCAIGDQKRYWNSTAKALGGCPPSGCTPPIDTLFEITAKCKPGSSCYDANERSFWDTSHVDGWSIPYRVRGIGAASEIAKCDPGFQSGVVDASQLSGAHCPGSEDISWNGTWPSVIVGGKTISLRTVDLRYVSGGKVLGCFSPCQKVTQTPVQGGLGQSDMDGKVGTYMCCPTHVANPTPDNCKPAAGCVLPPVCRAGPVPKTGYVKAIHAYVPGSYGYSYDDGSGNHNCPPGTVVYEMTFCPPGSAAYPASLPKPTTAGPKKTTTRRKSTTKVLFGAKRSSTKRRTTTKRRSSQRRSTSRRT
ncbi:hypothetical protein DFJ74DRAFT_673704 [Hyaloraphidium curvatum]|nr:hypothetical protein DFJ74DRAFT_673704 [Hyaloraphidium curvatum]